MKHRRQLTLFALLAVVLAAAVWGWLNRPVPERDAFSVTLLRAEIVDEPSPV